MAGYVYGGGWVGQTVLHMSTTPYVLLPADARLRGDLKESEREEGGREMGRMW